jgi:hypothetical protein
MGSQRDVETPSLIDFLGPYLSLVWKDWPMDMVAVTLPSATAPFSLRGTCPHCKTPSSFVIAGSTSASAANPVIYNDPLSGGGFTFWAIMQCQSCLGYILGSVQRTAGPAGQLAWMYREHYPLGRADDTIPSEIPGHIAADLKEGIRCRWVEAYNATGEMCRRALEGSCIEQGAPNGDKLVAKIDWLATNGKITAALKNVAHKIRLGGNYGAHAPDDPMQAAPMTAEHADALIEFTRDFFQHVYVMPAKLSKYDFSKSGMTKPTP